MLVSALTYIGLILLGTAAVIQAQMLLTIEKPTKNIKKVARIIAITAVLGAILTLPSFFAH